MTKHDEQYSCNSSQVCEAERRLAGQHLFISCLRDQSCQPRCSACQPVGDNGGKSRLNEIAIVDASITALMGVVGVFIEDQPRLRIARSAAHLLTTVQGLKNKGVAVKFLDQPELNTEGKYAGFLLAVLAGVAQLERDIMDEKRRDGIAAARAKGVRFGRPRLISDKLLTEALALKERGVAILRSLAGSISASRRPTDCWRSQRDRRPSKDRE